jgi:hypothetical protein
MAHSVPSKCRARGVIRGAIEGPLYVEEDAQGYLPLIQGLLNPHHELMKGCIHRLTSLVCMLIGMKA